MVSQHCPPFHSVTQYSQSCALSLHGTVGGICIARDAVTIVSALSCAIRTRHASGVPLGPALACGVLISALCSSSDIVRETWGAASARIGSRQALIPPPELLSRAYIDELRCIYCGMCGEACPCDAIELTPHYELVGGARQELIFDKEKLLHIYDATGELKPRKNPPVADYALTGRQGPDVARPTTPEVLTGASSVREACLCKGACRARFTNRAACGLLCAAPRGAETLRHFQGGKPMKRTALLFLGLAALLQAGCQKPNAQTTARVETTPAAQPASLDSLDTTGSTDTTAGDTYAGGGDPTGGQAARGRSGGDEVLAPSGGRVHVVQKGDTLMKLARKFYNDPSRWRAIWEANRNRIPDPNRLEVGTKLIIP